MDSSALFCLISDPAISFSGSEYQERVKNYCEGNHSIIIPPLVVAEILAIVKASRKSAVLSWLSEHVIPSFDFATAVKLDELYQKVPGDKSKEKSTAFGEGSRTCFKYDLLILAVAVLAKSHVMLTNDKRLKNMCNELTDVRAILLSDLPEGSCDSSAAPPPTSSPRLFDDVE
ncbi:type II toxin-antitoxin system VapC family toxin [Tuwongella immobilis]|uniref:type II toxin-antitoxin system VapC family toxin n=1 Tax=Tuwongella immobilis TaxID=692036 RepID=UPI001E2D715F|nr:type II toxin-antitoxin system VapC family toxin [Tuwongella immobilis]